MSPTCAATKAGSTCAPCAMRTRVESWDTPWASSTTRALVITALDMAAATRGGFPAGVLLCADRGTQFTSQKLAAYMRAVKGTVSMGQAAVCWDNAVAESLWAPHNRLLLPAYLHYPRPGLHRGRHLDRRDL